MGWIKVFKDGTSVIEPASWTQTKLLDIKSVHLTYANKHIELHDADAYWQYDTFTASPGKESILLARTIQCKIEKSGLYFSKLSAPIDTKSPDDDNHNILILSLTSNNDYLKNHQGLWLTAFILNNGKFGWQLKNNKG